jgi:rsbT co-antagonist protein RsbR
MTDEALRIGELLRSGGPEILERWTAATGSSLEGRVAATELERSSKELLTALGDAVDGGGLDVRTEAYAGVRALLAEMARDRARRGFTPTQSVSAVFTLSEGFFTVAHARAEAPETLIAIARWVDALALLTFEGYAKAREEVIAEQAEQLLELTTPVIKLWDGVLAVPLIGTLDSARTQIVMEKLLQGLVDSGAEHAIIDITGVPAVDTEVAQHLLKTVVAARLMGAECTISGIRPQIAQTIVALGIEFGDIPTKATLADALLHALRGSGVDVVGRQRRGSF